MKTIYIFLFTGLILLLSSCDMEDKGNYTYADEYALMPVKIKDIEKQVILRGETLTVVPEFELLKNEDHYEYTWYAIDSDKSTKTVLGTSKVLEEKILLSGGNYTLYFHVKDFDLDIFREISTTLQVIESPITFGWFLLKDDGTETDIDYFDKESREISENILGKDGNQMKGKAVKINYHTLYSHQIENEDGTKTLLRNQKAYTMLSTEDMKTFNATSWQLWKIFEDQFYSAPAVANPQHYVVSSGNISFINNGAPFTISTMTMNIGKFLPKVGSFDMSAGILANSNGLITFDKVSGTFLNGGTYGTAMSEFSYDLSVTGIDPIKNKEVTCLRIIQGGLTATYADGYAILKSTVLDDTYYLARMAISGYSINVNPFSTLRNLPSDAKLLKAEVVGVPKTVTCLYFGEGNKLYVHKDNDLPQREILLKEFPEGEMITYIGQISQTSATYPPVFNHLVVATNKNGMYKVYQFEFDGSNPEISTTPVNEPLTGRGYVRSIIYRAS